MTINIWFRLMRWKTNEGQREVNDSVESLLSKWPSRKRKGKQNPSLYVSDRRNNLNPNEIVFNESDSVPFACQGRVCFISVVSRNGVETRALSSRVTVVLFSLLQFWSFPVVVVAFNLMISDAKVDYLSLLYLLFWVHCCVLLLLIWSLWFCFTLIN